MKSKQFAAVFAMIALGTVVWAGAQAASRTQVKPTAVAVANIQKIFNSLKERQQIQANMQSQMKKLQSQEKAKRKEIDNLKSQLDVLQAGSKAYSNKENQLEEKSINLDAWVRYQQKKVNHNRALKIEELYRQTVKAVASVAKSDGYQIVLYGGGKPTFQYNSESQLANEIELRKVLWADSSVDITDQVTQQMNNAFENAGN